VLFCDGAVIVTMVGGNVTVEGGIVIVTGGGVYVGCGGGVETIVVAEMVVAPDVRLVVTPGEVAAPRVPEIVTAPREIEEPSATRFHFLNEATGKTVTRRGTCSGSEGRTLPGTKILPVLGSFARLENSMAVRVFDVEMLVTAENSTVAMVGKEFVSTASVMVVTGDIDTPSGLGFTLIIGSNGFSPRKTLMSPDCARTAFGLFTSVH
jgi:hypothetical protein